jgi:hypothetical protein
MKQTPEAQAHRYARSQKAEGKYHTKAIKEAKSDEMQKRKAARKRIEELEEDAAIEREYKL